MLLHPAVSEINARRSQVVSALHAMKSRIDLKYQYVPWPGVYLIVNLTTWKVYVGSGARSVGKRFTWHRALLRGNCHPNKHLQRSWNKYGENAFVFVAFLKCCPEECIAFEQFWIDRLCSANRRFGYNICPIAGSTLGSKLPPMSDERRAQNSEWGKRNNTTLEARKRSSEASLRRWSSEGAIEKHLKWLRQLWEDEEHKLAMVEKAKERWQDAEYRKKMSESRQAMWADAEFKERSRLAMRKSAAQPEEKARKSAAMEACWQDEEYRNELLKTRGTDDCRRRMSEARRKLWTDPAYREKVMAARKEAAQKRDKEAAL